MTSRIRKAVIPVAGYGTRFLPITKTIPKEMLPIINRPIIEYIVREMVTSGIEEIIFISSSGKHPLEDYFDYNNELDTLLKTKGKNEALELSREMANASRFTYIRQHEQLGTGHALLAAREIIGDEPFAFSYGDDIYDANPPAIAQLIETFLTHGGTVIGATDVPRDRTDRYGIIDPEPTRLPDGQVDEHTFRVKRTIEKPEPDEAPSTYAAAGRFVLTPAIFDALESIEPGKGGELWLADAVDKLGQQEPVYARLINGTYHDCGNILEYLKTVVHFGLNDPAYGDELRVWVEGRLQE